MNDKQEQVRKEVVALNKGMTVSEFEEHLRVNAGSIAFEEALAVYKATLIK